MDYELSSAVEIDAWLRGDGLVVTASERTARFLTTAFHRARRAEGLAAWRAPSIQDWQTFVRNAWNERSADGRVVLNSLQEQALWAGIVAARSPDAAQLAGARDRLANLAMEAHGLLCAYAPRLLNEKARAGWDQDAAAFSKWLADFDEACRATYLISAARLPLELTHALDADSSTRSPLLLAGFDRILPTQRTVFDAWGGAIQVPIGEAAPRIAFHEAADLFSELAACALWCKLRLTANPKAHLLVVTQDVPKRRGEIERAFLRFAQAGGIAASGSTLFEFSLGVPLSQIALARGAGLLLHWLDGPIDEHELDWLLSTGQAAASPEESRPLTVFVRALRRRNLQRTRWTLPDFLRQKPGAELPATWVTRMMLARRRLQEFARRPQSPLAWAELVPRLLESAGWPGARPLASAEFQAVRRWRQTVDDCASLGFDGLRIEWPEFLSALDRAVDETLFAPESEDAPILIAGPAESVGLTADGVWFLGANEEAWPARGATHPLLPLSVQREAGLPHALPKLDWELAAAMTRRLLASAPEVCFSYARQSEGVEARPSRVVVQLAGAPQPLPSELTAPSAAAPLTVDFADASQLPFPWGEVRGGSDVLTAQSQCPFKAFATARLGAEDWAPAEAGLTALERGLLLHGVLHSIWAGPPDGIRTHAELVKKADHLAAFVERHVRSVLQAKMPSRARECMPQRYLELEAMRLTDLVTQWLRYESTRVPFRALETEQKAATSVAGLTLHLRLDRIDRLIDSTLLVIDYKSGNVSPSDWDLPRPDDLQLPLYTGFALKRDEEIGGLVFAKVRTGKMEFAGRVRDARATLRGDLRGNTNLVKIPLTVEQILAWKRYIAGCSEDFLAGRAEVDPREYPKTCESCGLQALCRIEENQPQLGGEIGEEADDA